jgi:hypothetical protein
MATVKKIKKALFGLGINGTLKRAVKKNIRETNDIGLDTTRTVASNLAKNTDPDRMNEVAGKVLPMIAGAAKKGKVVSKAKTGAKVKDKKWIQKAIKKPGALRAQLGAKPGQPIPAGKLAAAAKKPGKLGQRARLAQTLKKMKKK